MNSETPPRRHTATPVDWAAELGTDFVYALGKHADGVVAGARDGRMDADHARVGGDHAEIGADIRALLRPDDWVLVKGSRAMQMEKVVESLLGEESN